MPVPSPQSMRLCNCAVGCAGRGKLLGDGARWGFPGLMLQSRPPVCVCVDGGGGEILGEGGRSGVSGDTNRAHNVFSCTGLKKEKKWNFLDLVDF